MPPETRSRKNEQSSGGGDSHAFHALRRRHARPATPNTGRSAARRRRSKPGPDPPKFFDRADENVAALSLSSAGPDQPQFDPGSIPAPSMSHAQPQRNLEHQ